MPVEERLLRTGEVARLMGCSRQHVVDLCNEGKLPCRVIGRHRRIDRRDLDAVLMSKPAAPRKEEARSLWLNRAIAGKLAVDPDRVIGLARRNLERFRAIHAGGSAVRWLDEWEKTLDGGPELVMRVLTSETPHARDLRQNSPFPGALSDHERRDVLGSFARHWRMSA